MIAQFFTNEEDGWDRKWEKFMIEDFVLENSSETQFDF
jgi:hypothetical protein